MRVRKINGNYYAYFYDRTSSPKEKSWPLRTSRKDVAWQKAVRLKELYDKGEFDPWTAKTDPLDKLTAREAKVRFLEAKEDLRPKTVEAYTYAMEGLLEAFPANIFIQDVRLKHVRPYLDDDTVSVATRRHRYRHIRTFFNWCVKEEHIKKSPLKRYTPPKDGKKVPAFLSTNELDELLGAIDDHIEKLENGYSLDREVYPEEVEYKDKKSKHTSYTEGELTWMKDVILLAVSTGMRRGELAALTWGMVDLENGYIHIRNDNGFRTKSGDERSIPLLADGMKVVKRLHQENPDASPSDPVLTTSTGGPISPGYTSKMFKLFVRLADLDERLCFHSLRHTCASWLAMKGVPLQMIQHVLGHSSMNVTEKYSHLLPDAIRDAMADALAR